MKQQQMTYRILALVAVLALPACDEGGVQPLDDVLSFSEEAELSVLTDPGSADVTVELADATTAVAASLGHAGAAQGRSLSSDARNHFQSAREALHAGDRRRALDLAREARRLAARALVATGGEEAVVALIERIEEFALTLDSADDDVVDDPARLKARLEELATAARELLAQGRPVAAAERALLGEQLIRYHVGRRDHRGDVHPDRARLAVALAGTAVQMATRLVEAQGTPQRDAITDAADHQNRWLAQARRMLAMAEEALASGHFARAVHFAHHAHWSALKAVILPGGITEEELRAMAELANNLYEEAVVAVGDDPTQLQARLLALAERLIERGEEQLEAGNKRGVAPLWRAAVISRWLIG